MKSSKIDHHSNWHMMNNTNTYAVQGSEGTFCHQVYVWKFMKAAKKQDYVTTDDVYLWPDLAFCHSCAARDKANIKNSEQNEKIFRKLPFFLLSHTNIYACVVFLGFLSHNTPKKISESEMSNKTDIAFSGCGFMGIYYVGVTNCIDAIAPDLLQQRIGGTSAGGPKKLFHF